MYKYVKVGQEVQNVSIPEDYQIDTAVKLKIRERYSPSGEDGGKPNELEMHRKGLIDPENSEYLEYLVYIDECVDWGKDQKEQAALDRSIWENNQWDESNETRAEFVARMEGVGLI